MPKTAILKTEPVTDNGHVDFLDLDGIIGINDEIIEELYVSQWKAKVRVKGMTAEQRDHYETHMFKLKTNSSTGRLEDLSGIRARVVAACLCDKDGKLLFSDKDDTWKVLNQKSAAAIADIFEVCMTLSGLGAEDEGKPDENLTLTPG